MSPDIFSEALLTETVPVLDADFSVRTVYLSRPVVNVSPTAPCTFGKTRSDAKRMNDAKRRNNTAVQQLFLFFISFIF